MADSTYTQPVNYMLTTVDNPFNPHTQFKEWLAHDQRLGHHTSALLARVVNYSEELSEPDQDAIVQEAIDTIIELNPNGLYRRVAPSASDSGKG